MQSVHLPYRQPPRAQTTDREPGKQGPWPGRIASDKKQARSAEDEFGGAIPVGDYAKIGGDEIGQEIVRSIGSSPAILMKNHGVFTIGKTPEAAVKAAVMVEDVARTTFYAMQLGIPAEIPAEEVARAHRRYVEEYGQ